MAFPALAESSAPLFSQLPFDQLPANLVVPFTKFEDPEVGILIMSVGDSDPELSSG
jgi:hypothetical protein